MFCSNCRSKVAGFVADCTKKKTQVEAWLTEASSGLEAPKNPATSQNCTHPSRHHEYVRRKEAAGLGLHVQRQLQTAYV
jgi:hypothetical protein